MTSDRMRQVNALLEKSLGAIIARDLDLPVGSLVTITRVDTSRDLKHAKVYVVVLPNGKTGSVLRLVQRERAAIQRALGADLTIKFTPQLRFVLDEREYKADEIYRALDQAAQG